MNKSKYRFRRRSRFNARVRNWRIIIFRFLWDDKERICATNNLVEINFINIRFENYMLAKNNADSGFRFSQL